MNHMHQNPDRYNSYYEDEIDLREYIMILWNRRAAIALVTLLSILAAGVMSFFVLEPVYEASTQILASADSVPNEVIKSPFFLSKVVEELDLPNQEPYTPFGLARSVSVQTGKPATLTVIKIEDTDPERASAIVNAVARLYVEFVHEKNLESVMTTVTFLTEQRDSTQVFLDEAKAALDQSMQSSRIGILKNEVDRLAGEINSWKSVLSTGDVYKAELAKGIEELASLLASTPATIPGPPDYAGRETQIPNQTYQQFESDLASKRIQMQELGVRLTQAQSKLPALEAQYIISYEKYLEADRKIRNLENLIGRLTAGIASLDAKITAASTTVPEAVVAAPALAPVTPIKPRKMLNMAVAAVLGVFVSVMVVFFIEYWKSPQTEGSQPVVQR